MESEYQIEIDSLALGMTRPTVYMGVEMKFFFANVVVGLLICIYSHSFFGVLFSIISYTIMRVVSQKDIHCFSVYATYYKHSMPLITYSFWGKTNSYEPW